MVVGEWLEASSIGSRLQQLCNPGIRLVHVKLAVETKAHRAHAVVMHVLAVDVEELGVHLEDPIELKAAYAHDLLESHARIGTALDRGPFVERAEAALELLEVGLVGDEISLIEEEHVGKGHLRGGWV